MTDGGDCVGGGDFYVGGVVEETKEEVFVFRDLVGSGVVGVGYFDMRYIIIISIVVVESCFCPATSEDRAKCEQRRASSEDRAKRRNVVNNVLNQT